MIDLLEIVFEPTTEKTVGKYYQQDGYSLTKVTVMGENITEYLRSFDLSEVENEFNYDRLYRQYYVEHPGIDKKACRLVFGIKVVWPEEWFDDPRLECLGIVDTRDFPLTLIELPKND